MVFPVVGGDGKPTGYEISNSYRIDQGSAVGMARFGNNSRNGNTFTISFWIKRTKLGEFQTIVTSKVEDSGVNAFLMTFQSDDTIKVQGQPASGTGAGASRDYLQTSAVYRDVSAWYHIVYRLDTTQSTASNRHRLYVNGVEQAKATDNPLDQNVGDAYFYNAGSYPYAIGNDERDNDYGNFYMAEHHYTDGVSNGPDAFGETNDNGVWIPKEYTGSHGSYGHYLKFEQSGAGSGTTAVGGHNYTTGSSSTIGADSSGNDNHFHVQGYSAEDNTTDTPTNNFATLNPLSSNNATLSEGNVEGIRTSSGSSFTAVSTIAPSNGKWYFEYQNTAAQNSQVAIVNLDVWPSGTDLYNFPVGESAAVLIEANANYNITFGQDASTNTTLQNSTNLITAKYGFAVDIDNNDLYVSANGNWYGGSSFNQSDFSNATAVTTDLPSNAPLAIGVNGSLANTIYINFGNPGGDDSISSGNADANGYGNFEYAVPSGYYALCTKNLAEYG